MRQATLSILLTDLSYERLSHFLKVTWLVNGRARAQNTAVNPYFD